MTTPRASSSDPMFFRLLVASELVRLREASGETQEEVERACGLNPSLLSNYEVCRSAPSVANAEKLLRHYGVDGDQFQTLLGFAREARRRPKAPGTDPAIPEWFDLYRRLEQRASELYLLALNLIPGLLQTRVYAEAVIGTNLFDADVAHLADVRMDRKSVLDNPELVVWAVIKETALLPAVGGAAAMREQLDYLLEMADRPNVNLRVLPNEAGAHASMEAEFHLMRFAIAPDFGLVYTERIDGATYLDAPDDVKLYEGAYRHLTNAALNKEPSKRLIQRIKDDHFR